jgi:hypothetical protein
MSDPRVDQLLPEAHRLDAEAVEAGEAREEALHEQRHTSDLLHEDNS